jgi:hypothetical protein
MDRALPIAAVVGVAVGVVTHRALVADPFVALAAGATYAGAAYFQVAFDLSLLAESPTFDDRRDRLGYAVGLFGVTVTPLAFGEYFSPGRGSLALVTVFVGVVAFLLYVAEARRSVDGS